MTRILCIGDLHVMDKPPAGATDLYLEDLFNSLHYTAKFASDPKNKIDAVVWSGDVFNHKNPARTSHATVLRLIKVVREYGVRLYIVIGNHDISNDRVESVYEKQPLGVILEAGATELNGWADDLPLYGAPWQQNWEDPEAVTKVFEGYAKRTAGTTHSLAVTHCSIFPPSLADDIIFDHVPAEDIAKAMGNEGSLYYGHIHEDHGVYEVDGVTFANVGALSRGSLHEYNIQRGIHMAVWEDGEFEVIDIPHMPATDILRVSEHYEEKREAMDLDAFVKSVGSSTLEITSTHDIVTHIKGMKDIDAPVKARSIELLEAADT